jgi:hypothetical protein
MNLFIRIVDGKPFEHPMYEDNFRQAFPNVDTNNLPLEFARFVRVPAPSCGVYEKPGPLTYELIDGVYTDVHTVVPMTAEEVASKQDAIKKCWVEYNMYASWIFNEELCEFKAPIPMPTDGKYYTWDEATLSWIEITNA